MDRFTVNVYAARGHATGSGGDGSNRGHSTEAQLNKTERECSDPLRAKALNEILAKLGLERFVHSEEPEPAEGVEEKQEERQAA